MRWISLVLNKFCFLNEIFLWLFWLVKEAPTAIRMMHKTFIRNKNRVHFCFISFILTITHSETHLLWKQPAFKIDESNKSTIFNYFLLFKSYSKPFQSIPGIISLYPKTNPFMTVIFNEIKCIKITPFLPLHSNNR